MKKTILLIIAAAVLWCAPADAAGKKYVIGVVKEAIKESGGGQSGSIVGDLVNTIAGQLKHDISLKWFPGDAELVAAAGSVDLMMFFDYSPMLDVLKKGGYKPFIGYSLFGQETSRGCIFVRSDSKLTNVKDLKGKKFIMYDSAYEYYLLRELIGAKPETFFGKTLASPRGAASLLEIGAKKADAAFVFDQNLAWVKMASPDVVKNLTPIVCAPAQPFYPIIRANGVPDEVTGDILKFFVNARKEPAAKRFAPMLTQFKIKFKAASEKDFQGMLKTYTNGLKSGWDKDFAKWLASAEKLQKK